VAQHVDSDGGRHAQAVSFLRSEETRLRLAQDAERNNVGSALSWHHSAMAARKASQSTCCVVRGIFPVDAPTPACTCGEGDKPGLAHCPDCAITIHHTYNAVLNGDSLPTAVLNRLADDESEILRRREVTL
jgi:hypothetical protein